MRIHRAAVLNALFVLPLAGICVMMFAASAAGQAPANPTTKAASPARTGKTAAPATQAKRGKLPRTADGHPDLQGVWNFSTVTPLERPNELGGKQVLDDEEAAEFEQKEASKADHDKNPPADIVGNYNEFWYDGNKKVVGTKRTSLIVDPADGRLPPLTPAAQQKDAAITEARRGIGRHEPTPGGWMEELGPGGLQVRCILGFNSGPPMTPAAYNQNVQIFQTAENVVLLNEMIHNARVVPMDGRPHGKLRQWVGDSRGRWDGDTLVVDTTNFLRETAFLNGKTSPNLHLVERFTRVDADTLLYEFTVEDPTVWTRAWTAQIAMAKSEQGMYEYACHEGNYGLLGILGGARAKESAGGQATAGVSK
jgi:hypothetical protein